MRTPSPLGNPSFRLGDIVGDKFTAFLEAEQFGR